MLPTFSLAGFTTAGAFPPEAVPHEGQNFVPSSNLVPQFEQKAIINSPSRFRACFIFMPKGIGF
jgi:hypothetical protein